jgi:type IV pilus assembly protein PilA
MARSLLFCCYQQTAVPVTQRSIFMKKAQQGFTLIELMIVVAIIGILAAIAIPAYQDYITRSKVTEVVTAADACKTSVAEYYQSQGVLPADLNASGCSSNATGFVASLNVTNGVISVAPSATLITAMGGNGTQFVLSPTAGATADLPLTWTCNTAAGTDFPTKYLPANCR